MNEIQKLQSKMREAIKSGRFADANVIKQQIDSLIHQREVVPVSSMFGSMTDEQKDKLRRLMVKMFVYADLLDSAVTDFNGEIRKIDGSVDVVITREMKVAKNALNKVVKVVDQSGNGAHSENHGKLCDEIKLVAENVLFKYENLDRIKMNKR